MKLALDHRRSNWRPHERHFLGFGKRTNRFKVSVEPEFLRFALLVSCSAWWILVSPVSVSISYEKANTQTELCDSKRRQGAIHGKRAIEKNVWDDVNSHLADATTQQRLVRFRVWQLKWFTQLTFISDSANWKSTPILHPPLPTPFSPFGGKKQKQVLSLRFKTRRSNNPPSCLVSWVFDVFKKNK